MPLLVTALLVGGLAAVSGLVRATADDEVPAGAARAAVTTVDLDALAEREKRQTRASRSAGRPVVVGEQVTLNPVPVDREFATEPLNIWRGPGEQGPKIGVLKTGTKVAVTGQVERGWAQIILQNPEKGPMARWVNAKYLAENKPKPEKAAAEESEGSSAPALGGACTNGTSVPSGVSPNIVAVHEAVCANFPEITTYGTFRSDGEHAQGIAVDIMVSGDRGWQVAEFLRSNYGALGISYLIYSQQIWSVDRSGEGWRGMEDRGSTTANHYDHVHVTTY